MKAFSAHGTLDVRVEGRLLIVEGVGPWNKESLEVSGIAAKPLVESLYDQPWGVVAIVRGEPIYVPEAADDLVTIVKEEKLHGRIASAVIVDDSNSPRFARNHISEIYRRAGETFEFFSCLEDAKAYIERKIAAATMSNIAHLNAAPHNPNQL